MAKPVQYRMSVPGFGTWRIAYATGKKRWELAYSVRAVGEQWVPASDYSLADSAAIAVAERQTGVGSWDGLRFAIPAKGDLRLWRTESSEGVQEDAVG